VVIPVHGKWTLTAGCLHRVVTAGDDTSYEMIVVDDCSSDETPERLAELTNVRSLRTPRNLGFVGTCNLGASAARGEILVFLNNDTAVQPGWLDHLVETFDDPTVGVAGSLLVGTDGTIQESGGIIFSDASGWNFARGEPPEFAAARARRDVDYCSGAALAIRRDLFERLGGFDTRFAPAYYEDTDLCFAARKAGYRVVVQPRSVVVHFEGASNGVDGQGGLKRFQRVNQVAFRNKWRSELASQWEHRSSVDVWRASNRSERGMVLVVEPVMPTPDRDSGSRRIWAVLEEMIGLGYAVYLALAHRHAFEPYRSNLEQLGVTVLTTPRDQELFMEQAGAGLVAVMLCRPDTAWSWLDTVVRNAPRAKLIYDTVDLHALRMSRKAELDDSDATVDEAQLMWVKECAAIQAADVTFVVSEYERDWLQEVLPLAEVRIVSNIHAPVVTEPELDGRRDIVFIGGYMHPPNVDAAHWAATEIMPLVRREVPDATLHLLGSFLPPELEALRGPGVDPVGWADDLAPWYRAARVVMAPLRYGAGVKGKVAEAIEHGVPVVGTGVAFEAMGLEHGTHVLCSDTAEGLAGHLVAVLHDDELWSRLAGSGQAVIEERFSARAARDVLAEVLAEQPRRPRRVQPALLSSRLDSKP